MNFPQIFLKLWLHNINFQDGKLVHCHCSENFTMKSLRNVLPRRNILDRKVPFFQIFHIFTEFSFACSCFSICISQFFALFSRFSGKKHKLATRKRFCYLNFQMLNKMSRSGTDFDEESFFFLNWFFDSFSTRTNILCALFTNGINRGSSLIWV